MREKGAVLIETVIVLPFLGLIAGSVFLLSILFIRYIQVNSLLNEGLRFCNTSAVRGLPIGHSDENPNPFEPIRTYIRELTNAYRVFPSHIVGNNSPAQGRFYIYDQNLVNNFINSIEIERVQISNNPESDIIITATISAEELLGISFFPLPKLTIESRGAYLFNADLRR